MRVISRLPISMRPSFRARASREMKGVSSPASESATRFSLTSRLVHSRFCRTGANFCRRVQQNINPADGQCQRGGAAAIRDNPAPRFQRSPLLLSSATAGRRALNFLTRMKSPPRVLGRATSFCQFNNPFSSTDAEDFTVSHGDVRNRELPRLKVESHAVRFQLFPEQAKGSSCLFL